MSVGDAASTRAVALRASFADRFGRSPTVMVEAPGRVNLIGEHTDYHDGLVLPTAIDRTMLIAASPAYRTEAWSVELPRGNPEDMTDGWRAYIAAVYDVLGSRGLAPPPAQVLLQSEIPIGAGLSSSAALTVGTTVALLALMDTHLPAIEVARVAQEAEHATGAPVGIMDPLTLAVSSGGALCIDCRRLTWRPVPIPAALALVVFDSGVPRTLSESGYRQRRSESERGLQVLRRSGLTVSTLRDVTLEDLEARRDVLDDVAYRRVRHVVTENARVASMVESLTVQDLAVIGQLMAASHESLRRDYEVSCPELDLLVELGARAPGSIGGRLTGAGFGGCTIHLVHDESVDDFRRTVSRGFEHRLGRIPRGWRLQPRPGVTRLTC